MELRDVGLNHWTIAVRMRFIKVDWARIQYRIRCKRVLIGILVCEWKCVFALNDMKLIKVDRGGMRWVKYYASELKLGKNRILNKTVHEVWNKKCWYE